jgi:hypothetical protein
MIFGNWKVSNGSIEWNAPGLNRFVIPKDGLVEITEPEEDSPRLYEWIMRATAEDWLTQDDLYDLNYAFVYAVARFGFDFDYEIFDATLEEQFDQFDMEDDDDPGF